MGILEPHQIEQLMNALNDGFDQFTLNVLVTTRIDKHGLQKYTSPYLPTSIQAFELITHAEAEDFTWQLINAARELRPAIKALQDLADELKMTPFAARPAVREKLERLVRQKRQFKDLYLFRSRLAEIEPQVCRVEFPMTNSDGREAETTGTAFLIGAGAIMTNFHVIEPLIERSSDGWIGRPQDVIVRFDYKKIGDKEINAGVTCGLGDPWLIDSSPVEELDYAILRLDHQAGNDPVGNWSLAADPPKRHWMKLAKTGHPFTLGTELIMVQHPSELPLVMDEGEIVSFDAAANRVTYDTNSEDGSSGSPCFNAALELVALHHAGDPVYGPAKFNIGIPIDAIVNLLEERGIEIAD